DPVQHPALGDRPPLYPCFAALCELALPFANPVTAARLGNVLLTAAVVLFAALYLRRLYGERVALAATAFSFFLPHSLYWTAQPLTEPLAFCLTLGALLCWSRARGDAGEPARDAAGKSQWAWSAAAGAGALAGLVYLTRPTGAL